MKKWYAYIILLASVLFASCNIEDTLFPDQECDTKTEPVNVRLILSMMGGRSLSRAPLTDTPTTDYLPDEEPLGNEYYINPYDVEVLVFTCGETPEKSTFVERASMVRASETDYYYQYQLDGTLTKIQEGTPYRMVVLANMNGSCYTTGAIALEEGKTTMTNYLESLVYTGYSASFTAGLLTNGSTERIPMWGTTAAYLNDGAQINMDLLRAMSKVKVKMPKNLGKELSAVTLEYANPSGYVTPLIAKRDENTATNAIGVSAITNNDAEKKTITGGNTQRVRTPRIPTGLTLIDSFDLAAESTLSFSDVSSTDNYEYVIYIPEYKNLGIEATPARMKLTIGDKPYKLEFKDYAQENPTGYFDIVRNYFYDYTITGVDDGLNLDFTLNVAPWTLVKKNVNYTETISCTYDGDGLGWSNVTTDIQDNTKIYMNPNGTSAIFKFKIEKPENPEWFVDLSGEGFDVSTSYQELTGGAIEVTVQIAATAEGKYEGILRVFVKGGGRFKEAPGSRYIIVKNYE